MDDKTISILVNNVSDIKAAVHDQGDRLLSLERAFTTMAVQNEKIHNTQTQVDALWRRMDESFGSSGIITKVRDHQQQCPQGQIIKIWWVLGIIATVGAGVLTALLNKI